uniref:Uncharacterized protein n=1 Tax=Rhizophora mucronata TaxID=61149 RepID=A0A2P2NP78_RHIMU
MFCRQIQIKNSTILTFFSRKYEIRFELRTILSLTDLDILELNN